MALYKQKLNPITGQFNLVSTINALAFKAGVATYTDLPVTGNTLNDARITGDTGHLYVWTKDASSGALTDWADQGDILELNWSDIVGRPLSTPANIDDAVSKRHASGSDNQTATTVPTTESGLSVQDELNNLNNGKTNKIRGTFSDGDLIAGILTVTHNWTLAAPYMVQVTIFDNTGKHIIPSEVTGTANAVAIDLAVFSPLGSGIEFGYLING